MVHRTLWLYTYTCLTWACYPTLPSVPCSRSSPSWPSCCSSFLWVAVAGAQYPERVVAQHASHPAGMTLACVLFALGAFSLQSKDMAGSLSQGSSTTPGFAEDWEHRRPRPGARDVCKEQDKFAGPLSCSTTYELRSMLWSIQRTRIPTIIQDPYRTLYTQYVRVYYPKY